MSASGLRVPKTEAVEEETNHPPVKQTSSPPAPFSQSRAMKEEFLQMKEEFSEAKNEVAKLMNAFDRKTREIGDFQLKIQAQLNAILSALSRKDAPNTAQMTGSLPLISQTVSSNSAPVKVEPPVEMPVLETRRPKCVLCYIGTHATNDCPTFPTGPERRAIMETKNRCLKCLSPLNGARVAAHETCMRKKTCKHCRSKEHRSFFCDNFVQDRSSVPASSLRYAPY